MKKLLLIVAILFATTAFGQRVYRCTSTTVGTYNYYSEKFTWDDYKTSNLQVVVKKNIILVNDRAGSIYILEDKIFDESVGNIDQAAWNATDESGKNCVAKLVRYEDNSLMLYIIYDNIAFGYTLKL